MRLKSRFTLALSLAAFLPTIVVAHLVDRNLEDSWRRETIAALQTQTVLVAFEVEAYLQRGLDLVATHAERPRLLGGLVTGSREPFGFTLRGLGQRSGLETMFIVDARGIMRFHNTDPSLVGGDFSHHDYYRGVLRTGLPYVSAPYIGQATKQPTVGLAAPIRDGNGRLQGLLVGTLTLRALGQMMDRLPRQHGNLMLVGPGGVILAHRDVTRLMQPAGTADPAIARVLGGDTGWREWADPQGAEHLSVFVPVRSVGWGLVYTRSLDDVYGPLMAGRRRAVVIALLVVAAAALSGALIGRGLVGPIVGLREGVHRLAGGDLRARLKLTRTDELGELAADIDTMADRLEEKVEELERRMRELAVLQQVDRGILAGTPIPDLLRSALHGFADLTGARSCFLVVPNAEDDSLCLLACHTPIPEELRRYFDEVRPRLSEGAAGLAIASRGVVASGDVATDVLWGRLREAVLGHGARAVVAVPLIVGQEVLGAVVLNYPDVRRFPEEELQAVQRFGGQLAIALHLARLREAAADRFRLEEASRVKSLFLANMSHELRTPLNAILGFGDLLQMETFGPLNEKQRRYMGHIHQASQHLLQLINDILDLSKAEAGQYEVSPEAVPLEPTLEAALLIVKGVADKKRVRLNLDVEDGLGTVWADPIRLKQMLYNLLSNAVKFTPEGGQVTLAARPSACGVEIAVIDAGIGIKAEDLPRLFTEFSQLGPRRHEGTGLGLALTKRLVELHGGAIRVDSVPGKGSTFTLTLPERASADAAMARQPVESPLPSDSQAKAA